MTGLRRWTFVAAPLLVVLAGGAGARAQELVDPALPDGAIPRAPVEVDGLVLYEVRGVSAFPAPVRAARHVSQILEAARDPKVDPSKVEVLPPEKGRTRIVAGDRELAVVIEADARLEGLTVHELALAKREAIERAIVRYREARTPARLATSTAHALAATGILGVLLALFLPLFRRVDRFVERRGRRHARELEEKSFDLLRADRVRGFLRGVLRAIRAVLLFALFYLYLSYTFASSPGRASSRCASPVGS